MSIINTFVFFTLVFASTVHSMQYGGWSRSRNLTDDLVLNASAMVSNLLYQAVEEDRDETLASKVNLTLVKLTNYRTRPVKGNDVEIIGYFSLECDGQVTFLLFI